MSERGRADAAAAALPAWFIYGLVMALCGILAYSIVAISLAMLSVLRPAPALLLGAALAVMLYVAWSREWSPRPGRSVSSHIAALAVTVLVLVVGALNARYSVEHLQIDRDPGVYTATGIWLAEHGSLAVHGDQGFFDPRSRLTYNAAGFYSSDGGKHMTPQFLHLLPAFLAAAKWIGGLSLLVKANAILGSLALLCFYAFAGQWLRPWLAALATAALAVNLPQIFFSRDTYSEILSQVFLFGGLFALAESCAQPRSFARSIIAGMLIGATCMVRVDAFLYLTPLAAWAIVTIYRERQSEAARGRDRFHVVIVAVSSALPASLGLLDGIKFSPGYLADLRSEMLRLGVLLVATVVAGLLFLALPRLTSQLLRSRRVVAHVVAVGIVAAGAYAFWLRPTMGIVHQDLPAQRAADIEAIQAYENQPLDGDRNYAELSLRWVSWYVGPVVVVAGLLGAALVTRRLLLGRDQNMLLFLLVFICASVLYVWRPSISPNQLWAMRRFLPVVIPGLIFLSAWACHWLLERARFRQLPIPPIAVLVTIVAIAAVSVPLAQLVPLWTMSDQRGLLRVTKTLCQHIGPNAAVIFTDATQSARYGLNVRTVCKVPVGTAAPDATPSDFLTLDREVEAKGRRLVLIIPPGPSNSAVSFPVGDTEQLVDHFYTRLEQTITRRPSILRDGRFQVFLVTFPRGSP